MRTEPRRPSGTRRPRRRDRHGRGLRGALAPVGVPLHRTPADAFDELVLDAVEHLERQWGAELSGVEFAVEDVPVPGDGLRLDHDVVLDRGVPLGQLFREGLPEITQPVIVIYRRPVEARAGDRLERADLVLTIVVDLTAEFLGKDADDIDPPR